MRITGFDQTGLEPIEQLLQQDPEPATSATTLKALLQTANLFFVAEGINRVQSTLLCELKASYVQQSQRYVAAGEEGYTLPKLEEPDLQRGKALVQEAFQLYRKMSQRKDQESKGRPKPEDYCYGIPIEDARYILPLAAKTNLSHAMSGDKLLDLFQLACDPRYEETFTEITSRLTRLLPPTLVEHLTQAARESQRKEQENRGLVGRLHQSDWNKVQPDHNMVLLRHFGHLDQKVALGALTSTQSRTSSETLAFWREEASEKAKGVVERVLGYGHDSIAEQARTTFGMMCSLAAYHQQIRHRLPSSVREDFSILMTDLHRPPVIPPTIGRSPFAEEYLRLVERFKMFRREIYQRCGLSKALPFLLNGEQIKIILSTNARIDREMLAERTCRNAQWEIRELAVKKVRILRSLSETLYEKALPSCVTDKCKEGKLSCGKQKEVRQQFQRT